MTNINARILIFLSFLIFQNRMNELGAGASPGPVGGGPTPSLPRSEVPSSRSSMVDSASEMSESDTDAMSLSGKTF